MSISKRTIKGKKQYRYIISFKDGDKYKQKASKWFDSASEAKKAEAHYLKENPIIKSSSDLTFEYVFNEFVKSKEAIWSRSTLKRYLSFYKSHIKNAIGNKKMEKITAKDINAFLSHLDFSDSSKKTILSSIKAVFKYAERYHDINNDCLKKVTPLTNTKTKTSEKPLSPEDFEKFLNSIPESKTLIRDFFYLIFWTGLRFNEARSLTFNHVKGNTLIIDRQLITMSVHCNEFGATKNKKSRRVTVDDTCKEIINKWREYYQTTYPNEFTDEWFVFGGFTSMNHQRCTDIKDAAIKKSGVQPFRIHDLRHAHASYLIEKGVNLVKISRRLGHASITMTVDRYGHLLDEDSEEVLNAIMSEKCQKND